MFRLEALTARHGDCLLLHWGEEADPRLALIDGGPGGTYTLLKRRLEQLAAERGGTAAIQLMMLSHIDDDHINGLLAFGEDLVAGTVPAKVSLLWHNSLEDLLDGPLPAGPGGVTASVAHGFRKAGEGWDDRSEKVLASVPQGQHLHAFARTYGLEDTMNYPFAPLVMARPGQGAKDVEGLEFQVVAPDVEAVEKLRKAWKRFRKDGILADYNDRSPYNLSSIVVIARYAGRSMLLTGDALGSEIMEGLGRQGLLDDDGKAHFDLIKLPHHGSQNNVALDFFQRVTADTYVVSGDHGKFPNPHPNAMGWLKEARGDAPYEIHCTYDLDYMRDIFGERLRVPKPGEISITARLA